MALVDDDGGPDILALEPVNLCDEHLVGGDDDVEILEIVELLVLNTNDDGDDERRRISGKQNILQSNLIL